MDLKNLINFVICNCVKDLDDENTLKDGVYLIVISGKELNDFGFETNKGAMYEKECSFKGGEIVDDGIYFKLKN